MWSATWRKQWSDWLGGSPCASPLTGSYFSLDEHTCHPRLTVSEDGLTVVRSERRGPAKEPVPSDAQFTRYCTSPSPEQLMNPPNMCCYSGTGGL